MSVNETILEEAGRIVNGPRSESYGDPVVMGERIGKIWSAILGCEVTASQVQLCMIGLKIARECNKPGRDNRVDIAGYAQVLDKVQDADFTPDAFATLGKAYPASEGNPPKFDFVEESAEIDSQISFHLYCPACGELNTQMGKSFTGQRCTATKNCEGVLNSNG